MKFTETTAHFKRKTKTLLIIQIIVFFLIHNNLFSQEEDNWDNLLNKELENTNVNETSIFKSSKILNGQSVQTIPKRGLDLRIAHKFAEINNTNSNFLGLNEASAYFGLFYGITDKLNVGIARATYYQTNYGFIKYLVINQSTGKKKTPFTIVVFANINHTSKKFPNEERNNDFTSRLDYSYQVLIGRKLSKRFSFQISPTLVHRNLVETKKENNNLYSLGFGGKFLITQRLSFNAEYYWVANKTNRYGYSFYDPIALGFNIQVGSHVFQLMITNVAAITENKFIGETSSNFFSGDIRLGFNISQMFSLRKK